MAGFVGITWKTITEYIGCGVGGSLPNISRQPMAALGVSTSIPYEIRERMVGRDVR